MKKITLTLTVVSVLSLHAQESFGLMQGLANSIFGSDDKIEKKVDNEVSSKSQKTDSVTVTENVKDDSKALKEEESFGLMQGLADSFFGPGEEEKNMSPEQKKARKNHITLKEEINDKEPFTIQNWFDKQLNQGKYDPEKMTEEQRERFLAEEAATKKQSKIDHEKGFTLQSIVDNMFDQGEYSGEKIAK